jgi:protein SCO1/2
VKARWAAVVLVLAAAGCGGGGGGSDDPTTVHQSSFPAPPLALHQVDGGKVTLAGLRGKPVVVTFVYSHCKNTCPLILNALKLYSGDLGSKAKGLQILAVSVDPKGDTPAAVRAFLKRKGLTGTVRYLIGTAPQLERTWHAWHIQAGPDPTKKDPEQREHTAAIYFVDAKGQVQAVQVASPVDPNTLQANLNALVKA